MTGTLMYQQAAKAPPAMLFSQLMIIKQNIKKNQLQKYQMSAHMHQVEMTSSTEGQVIEGKQLKVQHYVNLHYQTCTTMLTK